MEQVAALEALTFGPFSLVPCRRLLLRGDREVRLGARALDLLVLLVRRAGTVLSNEELTACTWPRTVVEGVNLRVQMSLLRKALDDGADGASYITNVPGRGYVFVATVRETVARRPSPLIGTPLLAGGLNGTHLLINGRGAIEPPAIESAVDTVYRRESQPA